MMQQEHVFFEDSAVRVTDTSITLHKGGVYPTASVSQVDYARIASNRKGAGFLTFMGLLFLLVSWLLTYAETGDPQNWQLPFEHPVYYQWFGGSLLLLALLTGIFQVALPVYVVRLRGSFGSAQPVKSRSRNYAMEVATAIQQAIQQAANRGHHMPHINISPTFTNSPVFHNTPTFQNNPAINHTPTNNSYTITNSLNNAQGNAIGPQSQATQSSWPPPAPSMPPGSSSPGSGYPPRPTFPQEN